MERTDAGGTVGADLLPDGEMQPQMQEWILCTAFGQKLGLYGRRVCFEQLVILRVLGNQSRDLRLQRLQGLAVAKLSPRVDINTAQLRAALLMKDWHGAGLA